MLSIFDILRASSVKRFHIVETIREQRLSEHLFSVAVLAGEIAGRAGVRPVNIQSVMIAALFHDIEEVVTGDSPTQTKKRIREAGIDVNTLFNEYKVIVNTDVITNSVPDLEKIIKCADYLDALFFLKESGVGRHAEQAYEKLYQWSMEYFGGCGRVGNIARSLLEDHGKAQYTI